MMNLSLGLWSLGQQVSVGLSSSSIVLKKEDQSGKAIFFSMDLSSMLLHACFSWRMPGKCKGMNYLFKFTPVQKSLNSIKITIKPKPSQISSNTKNK